MSPACPCRLFLWSSAFVFPIFPWSVCHCPPSASAPRGGGPGSLLPRRFLCVLPRAERGREGMFAVDSHLLLPAPDEGLSMCLVEAIEFFRGPNRRIPKASLICACGSLQRASCRGRQEKGSEGKRPPSPACSRGSRARGRLLPRCSFSSCHFPWSHVSR